MSYRSRLPVAALSAALALGGCAKPAPESDLDKADERAKLGDEILVDPALAAGEKHGHHHDDARPRHGDAHGGPHAPHGDEGPPEPAPPPPSIPPPVEIAKVPPAPPIAPAKVMKAPSPPAPHERAAAAPPAPARTHEVAKAPPPPSPPTAMKKAPVAPAAAPKVVAQPTAPAPTIAMKKSRPAPAKATRSAGNCLAKLQPGASWATKLPAAFPLYPKATLVDAAGIDHDGCNARVVSFTVAAPTATLIDWYRTRATKAGFDAGVQRSGKDEVLAGTGTGDSAYLITFGRATAGVTTVDIIVNGAR